MFLYKFDIPDDLSDFDHTAAPNQAMRARHFEKLSLVALM